MVGFLDHLSIVCEPLGEFGGAEGRAVLKEGGTLRVGLRGRHLECTHPLLESWSVGGAAGLGGGVGCGGGWVD
jgi:hypothetical protein